MKLKDSQNTPNKSQEGLKSSFQQTYYQRTIKILFQIFVFIIQLKYSKTQETRREARTKMVLQMTDGAEIAHMTFLRNHILLVKKNKPKFVYYFSDVKGYKEAPYLDMGQEIKSLENDEGYAYVWIKTENSSKKISLFFYRNKTPTLELGIQKKRSKFTCERENAHKPEF